MAESLRDLVVSLSLNTDNFTRNIKSVNKQIQEAESYFKLACPQSWKCWNGSCPCRRTRSASMKRR